MIIHVLLNEKLFHIKENFLYCSIAAFTWEKNLNISFSSPASSPHVVPHLRKQKRKWGVGSKVWGLEKHERELFSPLGAIRWVNARLCVHALWAECEDMDDAKTLFGTKRKHFPVPLHWLSAQSLLAFAGFSQLLYFEAARTFSPHERLTGKSRHVPPTELLCRLTWSMQSQSWRQNHTKMRFIKA